MSDADKISGLTPEQQRTLYREDLPTYKTEGFLYAFEEGGGKLRVAYLDGPDNATHAVTMPTGLALDFARRVLRAVAQPQKPTTSS